jgi:hypothetical protein
VSLHDWIEVVSALMTLVGLLFVAIQMWQSTRQRKLEYLYQTYGVNRELMCLGFDHPELFTILSGVAVSNPAWERHYLQMWLNQLSLVHTYLKNGGFDAEFHESLKRDIAEFMTLQNMRSHWQRHAEFYPPSFQRLVNGILDTTPLPTS